METLTITIKKIMELMNRYGWPGNALGMHRDFISISDDVYCSRDSRRWTQESIHYSNLFTFPVAISNLNELKSNKSFEILMDKACATLFKIIKENFFVPIINTFHIIDYQCRRQDDNIYMWWVDMVYSLVSYNV